MPHLLMGRRQCWWECKMTQILWEIVCQFLVKLNIYLSYDPGIPLLNIFSREIKHMWPHRNLHMNVHSNFKQESNKLKQPIQHVAAAAAKSLQSCPTLCDPRDGSPPGSPVPGTLQARTLEWVAISFSNAWKWKVKVKSLSRVQPSATPWTAAFQAPPSMGFSRQEYWNRVPLPIEKCIFMGWDTTQ